MENTVQGNSTGAKVTPFNGAVSGAATSAHGAVDKAAAAAGSAIQTVNAAIDSASATGHQAVNKIESAVKPAEQWVSEKAEAILAAPKNVVADARQFIVTHPWQSLAAALFAGALLGRRTR